MSKKKAPDSYEVGYGKPPRNTQFRKGVSGNPKGRPKKALDFDLELIRESESFMTINENGRQKRISKHEVVIKQLIKQAMTGSTQALRIYLALHQQAHEKAALMKAAQSSDPRNHDDLDRLTDEELMRFIVKNLPDEELERLIAACKKAEEKEREKGHLSNAE
jgi:hypothetical protein